MSITKDWFQQLYDEYEETFLNLVDVSMQNDISLHLSITPDKTIIFSSDDGEISRTIVHGGEAITYTQYQSLKEEEDGNDR